MKLDDPVAELQEMLSRHLDEIQTYFKNPKVTLVVRNPDLNDGDVVIGDDDLELVVGAITRLKDRVPAFAPVAQESRSSERSTHGQAEAAAEPPTSRPGDTGGNPGSSAAAGRDAGSIPAGGAPYALAMLVLQSDLYRQDADAREAVDEILARSRPST
jgi:hypothetical protein